MTASSQDPYLHVYENQPVNDLIVTVRITAGAQKQHGAFQGQPLPEYVTLPDKLAELAGRIETTRDESLVSKDPVKLALLDTLVAEVVRALRFNAHHVVLVSQYRNDPTLLQGAGYDLRPHPAPKGKVNLLDLEPELEARLGPVGGSINVFVKKRRPKASVELRWTDNPNDEHSWRALAEGTYNSSRIELRGLEPVKRIYIQGRFHQDGKVGRWSSPINIIVH